MNEQPLCGKVAQVKDAHCKRLNPNARSANNTISTDVKELRLRSTYLQRSALLFPAVTWLFVQFAMAGVFIGSSANAMQIEICSPFGVQQITIDLETGEPVEPVSSGEGCDWCQSFGLIVDMAARGDDQWQRLANDYQHKLVLAPPPHKPLYLVADYQSRAPPVL